MYCSSPVCRDSVFNGNSINSVQQKRYNVSGKARYVRIISHGNTSNAWNSITEMDMFGSAADSSSLAPPQNFSIAK